MQLLARWRADRHFRIVVKAVLSLVFNLLFAFYNGIVGFLSSSPIFVASAAYYLLLCVMRFLAVFYIRKRKMQDSRALTSAIGILLILLSILFHSMVIVSMKDKTAAIYGTITMITIASFTFTKITTAAVTAVKHRKEKSWLYRSVNAVRYSEVAVSLLTMQQSMLVSFEGADEKSAVILNACTGAGVCFFILALGIRILKRKEIKMSKSKFVKANEKIAETVVDAYKKVEDTVVDGYKKVENAVVSGYTKIEDKFVDRYLKKDGETVEDAKKRLKKEEKK